MIGWSSSTVLYYASLGGGIHIFFGDRGSIDIWMVEMLGVGKEKERNEAYETSTGTMPAYETEDSIITDRTFFFLGLSLWP